MNDARSPFAGQSEQGLARILETIAGYLPGFIYQLYFDGRDTWRYTFVGHRKVLYTSGYTENAMIHHGRLDPGIQLLSKPYRRAELARMIYSILTDTSPEPDSK